MAIETQTSEGAEASIGSLLGVEKGVNLDQDYEERLSRYEVNLQGEEYVEEAVNEMLGGFPSATEDGPVVEDGESMLACNSASSCQSNSSCNSKCRSQEER